MRTALYARYSADRQNERSIEDQFEIARRLAKTRGWTVVAEFCDAAISGAAMANRPGLNTLLAAADGRAFDVVLVEDTDRLARDREHDAHIFKRLSYAGISISTFTVEKVGVIESTLKGLMNELYLVQLSEKTKRGMHSNAEKGMATGSRVYGYRSQPGGALAIVEDEAKVVREIFARFGQGQTLRAICSDLNARALPGPRGGFWNPSTLSGDRHRGNGVIGTELYVGVKVWNRIEMRKDPQSGQRISRARPPEEWKRTEVPHLRILTDEAWTAAQARRTARAAMSPQARKPATSSVFSGLIKCAECGASMTAFNSRGRLICVARREKGPAACTNDRSVPRAEIDARVLEGLRTRLLSPAAVKAYVRLYHEAWRAKQAASTSAIAPLRKRLGELSRGIERLVDAICDGTASPAMRQRLMDQEAEKAEIEARLAQAERDAPPPITLHPKAAERYAERIGQLQAVLSADGGLNDPKWQAVAETVRELVVRIDVRAIGNDGEVMINLHGTLAAFVRPRENEPAPRLFKTVAGGGIEPPTCGL